MARLRKQAVDPLTIYAPGKLPGVFELILKGDQLSAGLLFETGAGVIAWRIDCGRPEVAKHVDGVSGLRSAARWFSPEGDRFSVPLVDVPASIAVFDGAQLDSVAKEGPLPGGGAVAVLRRPSLEYGIQTPDLHEYFVSKGDGITGVVLLRRKDDGWSASVSKTLVPYVLSKEAVRDGVMPPDGTSALPASLERVVPIEHRYWTMRGADALQARNALVESGLFDERLIKVVDGEMRLCVERLFLYEPTAALSTEKRASGGVLSLLPLASWARIAQPFLAKGEDWERAAARLDATDALTILSPPNVEVSAAALVAVAKSLRGDWLVECAPSLEAHAELAKIGRPFALAGMPDRMLVASFPLAHTTGVEWLDTHTALRKALAIKTIKFQGITIKVDRPAGFVQKGKDANGVEWERTYKLDYGFFPRTEGGDGEELDVFVGPDESSTSAYWVTQNKADGSFDEYKVFVGFSSAREAKAAYADHIPLRFFGGIHETSINLLKSLLGVPIETAKRLVSKIETSALLLAQDAEPGDTAKVSKAASIAQLSKVCVEKEDQRYVLGVVLEPETIDSQRDIYSADEVARAAHIYMAQFQNTGLMHKQMVNGKVKVVESYIAPCDFAIGEQPVKRGSWVMAVKILDDGLWQAVKDGTLTGFSIGGSAVRQPEPS